MAVTLALNFLSVKASKNRVVCKFAVCEFFVYGAHFFTSARFPPLTPSVRQPQMWLLATQWLQARLDFIFLGLKITSSGKKIVSLFELTKKIFDITRTYLLQPGIFFPPKMIFFITFEF